MTSFLFRDAMLAVFVASVFEILLCCYYTAHDMEAIFHLHI